MGILTTVISGVKSVFGGSKAVDELATGIIKGADALVFTEEERVAYNKDASQLWLEVQRVTATENTERSRSRRHAAAVIMINGTFAFWVILVAGWFVEGFGDYALALADRFYIGEMMFGVSVFFFGNQLLGRFNENKQLSKVT